MWRGPTQAAHGVAPGMHVSLKSTSEAMRLTLAYAAAQACLLRSSLLVPM